MVVGVVDFYDLLREITKETCGKTISGDFAEENKCKIEIKYWKTYELIKNICTLVVNYHDNIADFQPGYWFEGKRSFAICDLCDEDYRILEGLEFDRLPVRLAYRVSDLLWEKKRDYKTALKAYSFSAAIADIGRAG